MGIGSLQCAVIAYRLFLTLIGLSAVNVTE